MMKTATTHVSNFGSFRPAVSADASGYITYHSSNRYATATDEQLDNWSESRVQAVRNAVAIERSERAIGEWRAA